jgi:hypothetical protein
MLPNDGAFYYDDGASSSGGECVDKEDPVDMLPNDGAFYYDDGASSSGGECVDKEDPVDMLPNDGVFYYDDGASSSDGECVDKEECSQNCAQGGERMHYSSDEDEDDESQEAQFHSHAKYLLQNRGYDGSRCFCKPCTGCYGVWIPTDCHWGAICRGCNPPWGWVEGQFDSRTAPDSTSEINEFLARNARAHWRLVRWCVRVRPWALHWLSYYTERRYAPAELDMAHELASASG